jgi:prepilin-type N-terminal cleavage/methylation domain-containing protein
MTRRAPVTRRRGDAGVTLVELLIAVALLGFILLGIAPLFIGSVKSNFSANEYTSIHNLARDRLEQLMSLPFNDPQLGPGVHGASDLPPTLPDPRTGVPPAPGPGAVPNPFELSYEVRQFVIPPEAQITPGASFAPTPVTTGGAAFDYKRIDVTVRTSPGRILGIGSRVARVSGVVSNPAPTTNLSVTPLPTPTP